MDLNQFLLTLPRTGRVVEVWQKGSGPDLVFLHGTLGLQIWTPELDQLSKSFRVTVPHFPGYGRSTGAEGIYDLWDAVLHLSDVFRDLKLSRPHLAGHSLGGMLAAEYTAAYPGEVGRLVLISACGLWSDSHPGVDIFAIASSDIGRYAFHDPRNPMAKALSHVPGPDEPALVDGYVAHLRGLASAGRLMWPIAERGLSTRLDRIATPTLIVWGENDRITSVHHAREFAKRITGSKLRLFKEAGHMVQYEHPKALANSVAQFLLDPALKVPERPPALREAIKMAPDRASQSEAMRLFVEKLQMKQAEKIAAAEGLAITGVKPGSPPAKGASAAPTRPSAPAKPAAKAPVKPEPRKASPAKHKPAPAKKAAAKKPAPKKPAAQKPPAKKSAPKKPAPKKAPTKKPVPKKPAPKKPASKKPAPKKAAKKPAPKKKKR